MATVNMIGRAVSLSFAWLGAFAAIQLILVSPVYSFVPRHNLKVFSVPQRCLEIGNHFSSSKVFSRAVAVSLNAKTESSSDGDSNVELTDSDLADDQKLLKKIKKAQLVDLCEQLGVSPEGTKEVLLYRLRDFANKAAEKDAKRKRAYKEEVENNLEGKERHEIRQTEEILEDSEEDYEGKFRFHVPGYKNKKMEALDIAQTKKKEEIPTPNVITAPPPPKEPNADGERVVEVYSSTAQNDLTGVAAAQPTGVDIDVGMRGGQFGTKTDIAPGEGLAGGPFGDGGANERRKATDKELEEAREKITELAQFLLAMTGAPGFQDEYNEGLKPYTMSQDEETEKGTEPAPFGFIGFDPTRVPGQIISEASRALRAGKGQVLEEVMREFEIQAIGHDGMAGDEKEKGGGHYSEVQKVSSFLNGYRQAEVRRISRTTTALLLDKLVTEGVKGLDLALATMTRGSDDTNEEFELNDSLVDYLTDAIREQEKKVQQLSAGRVLGVQSKSAQELLGDVDDPVTNMWNRTVEDGQMVESLDPNDPKVKKLLEEELARSKARELQEISSLATDSLSAKEKILMLLKLLRDRVKAEAAFGNDEKGRNLRLLAYCMHARTDQERIHLIQQELGASIDRMDSFMELIESSINYAKSTTHQLQPRKTVPLNPDLLETIHALVKELRERTAFQKSARGPKGSVVDSGAWQ